MVTRAQRRAAFRKWYENNKGAYNEQRRNKYREDPELRDKILSQQRDSRAETPRKTSDGRTFKQVGKKTVEVVRIGKVAEEIGRDPQVVRIWEREGKIPRPIVPGGQRYYTMGQLALLREFAELMTEVRYDPAVRSEAVEKKSAELHAKWKTA